LNTFGYLGDVSSPAAVRLTAPALSASFTISTNAQILGATTCIPRPSPIVEGYHGTATTAFLFRLFTQALAAQLLSFSSVIQVRQTDSDSSMQSPIISKMKFESTMKRIEIPLPLSRIADSDLPHVVSGVSRIAIFFFFFFFVFG
jgi:hypothetical protein